MMTLARICGQHRHAVERDLIALGFDGWDSVGVDPRLTLWKLISIVLASPPNTAVYHAETRSGTMTPEQQLLAQAMGYGSVPEQVSPQAQPQESVVAVGQDDSLSGLASMTIGDRSVMLEALPPDELKAKREEIAAKIRASEGEARDTVLTEKYDPFEAGKRARAERLKQMQNEGPELPAHIANVAAGPQLPAHIGGM